MNLCLVQTALVAIVAGSMTLASLPRNLSAGTRPSDPAKVSAAPLVAGIRFQCDRLLLAPVDSRERYHLMVVTIRLPVAFSGVTVSSPFRKSAPAPPARIGETRRLFLADDFHVEPSDDIFSSRQSYDVRTGTKPVGFDKQHCVLMRCTTPS